jgi:hypothetical protein
VDQRGEVRSLAKPDPLSKFSLLTCRFRRNPTVDLLARLGSDLKVPLSELFREPEPGAKKPALARWSKTNAETVRSQRLWCGHPASNEGRVPYQWLVSVNRRGRAELRQNFYRKQCPRSLSLMDSCAAKR